MRERQGRCGWGKVMRWATVRRAQSECGRDEVGQVCGGGGKMKWDTSVCGVGGGMRWAGYWKFVWWWGKKIGAG